MLAFFVLHEPPLRKGIRHALRTKVITYPVKVFSLRH